MVRDRKAQPFLLQQPFISISGEPKKKLTIRWADNTNKLTYLIRLSDEAVLELSFGYGLEASEESSLSTFKHNFCKYHVQYAH
jgi:hypothetical protein